MLRLQVGTPTLDNVLEPLLFVGFGIAKDVNGFRIGYAFKFLVQHETHFLNQLHGTLVLLFGFFFVLLAFA